MEWIVIALGGGVGASLRYAVTVFITKLNYPVNYATVIVNLIGSFLLGLVIQKLNSELILTFLAIGVLGAFTTFSTFAFDLVKLFNEKYVTKTIIYLSITLIGGLAMFALGFYI